MTLDRYEYDEFSLVLSIPYKSYIHFLWKQNKMITVIWHLSKIYIYRLPLK